MPEHLPRRVSRFEANLLHILHCFVQRAPIQSVLPLIFKPCPAPRCLSRDAVELAQDALAKGCVRLLARCDGWRHERYLRGDRLVEGRLWERTPPQELALTFSGATLEFLIWITAADLSDTHTRWEPTSETLTLGDRVFLLFAYAALRATGLTEVLKAQPAFAKHELCCLAFPEDFSDNGRGAPPDWTPWMCALGLSILEALQSYLVERWLLVEREKRRLRDGRAMLALGRSQAQVLDAFLDAIEGAGRPDLARFLLQVLAQMLENTSAATDWVGSLDLKNLRLADRTDIYRSALAVLHSADRLQQWERRARTVGYFDDGYAASQMWKSEWEHWSGDTLHARAQAVIRALEPLRTGG
jgi:hypothetical protein